MTDALVPYGDLERMADTVVKAGLFPGIKTTQQALTLFLVAQAEGLHPMTATMRYNIISGRPAMKSEAMLASFIERGGTVDWTEYTDTAVTGIFTSKGVPKGVTVRWTMDDAKRAGVTMNQTWTKYPRQMLKARVASDGVRMADPAVNQGRYTPEEVVDFEPQTVKADAEIVGMPVSVKDNKGVLVAKGVIPFVGGEPAPVGKGLSNRLITGEERREPETSPDLTQQLTESIEVVQARKYAAEAKARSAAAVDAYVTVRCPDCASECLVYESSQTGKNLKRKYRQCKVAHENIEYLISQEGFTAQKASALNAKHYRQWVEPPPSKIPADDGAAPEASSGGVALPPVTPEEPAPSIFETLDKISADAKAKFGDKP